MSHLKLLVINPGSTSTKVGVFSDEGPVFAETLSHSAGEIAQFPHILDQYGYRRDVVLGFIRARGLAISDLDAVVGRGGLLRPVPGGVYLVTDWMIEELLDRRSLSHPCNLGAILAHEIARDAGVPAMVADPPVVDELWPVARISGLPDIERRSIFHALNQKAIARRAAADIGQPYDAVTLIVAHMGGGISVGVHRFGKVVDVSSGLEGEGPFTPERTGELPTSRLLRLAVSGKYSHDELMKIITRAGGLIAYLGTNDLRRVEAEIEGGNVQARFYLEAMAYQIAKEIGRYSTVASGRVDAIALTGGLAYSNRLVGWIKERVEFIAPVLVYPGEDELVALASAAIRVLKGKERPMLYMKEGIRIVTRVVIDEERCKGCELCMSFCPRGAIAMSDRFNSKGHHPAALIAEEKCNSCGICAIMCPDVAIEVYR